MKKVSIIVPTYNEAKNLPLFIEEIWSVVDKENFDLEFIVVDDNSPDGTGQVAEDLKNKYPVKVIHRSGKLGLGSAVIEGFKKSNREYLGVMDADLSHDPVIINQLIRALDENDISIGSRFVNDSIVEKWAWWRRLISVIGVSIVSKIAKVQDPLSGYFFIRKQVIENVILDTKGYKILFEILIKGNSQKVKEIPFTFRMRKFSTSKLNYKEYFLFLKQIVSYSFYVFFKKKNLLIKCFLCGSRSVIPKYVIKGDFSYSRCPDCNIFSLQNIPNDLGRYYGEGYFTGDISLDGYLDYEAEKKQSLKTFNKYLGLIKKFHPDCREFFEIGCATGFFLEMAKKNNWNVSGIDISEYAVKEALKKGLNVEQKNLEEFAKNNTKSYDVVVLLDTIEHLVDPVGDLKKIRGCIKNNGLIAFSTPDAGSLWSKIWNKKWHAFVPPQHINLFSKKNVTRVLKAQGFEVVFVGHYGKNFSLPYVFRLLKTWTGFNVFGFVANYCSRNFLRKVCIPINIGDTMFVIAKKV